MSLDQVLASDLRPIWEAGTSPQGRRSVAVFRNVSSTLDRAPGAARRSKTVDRQSSFAHLLTAAADRRTLFLDNKTNEETRRIANVPQDDCVGRPAPFSGLVPDAAAVG